MERERFLNPSDPRAMDKTAAHNLDPEQWSQQEPPTICSMKAIRLQCLAALAIFAVNFSSIGLIENVVQRRFEALLTFVIAMYVGFIVGGLIAQIFGGRLTMGLSAAALTGCWLTYGFAQSDEVVRQWVVHILAFALGTMQGPCYVYLAEISQPNTRNALMATVHLSSVAGSYYTSQLMDLMSVKKFAFLSAVFPAIGFILICFLPDSPYWLANKGNYHGVESSLARLKGCRTTAASVKSESTAIIDSAKNSPTVSKLFGRKSLYIPVFILFYVFLVKAFSGIFYSTHAPYNWKLLISLITDKSDDLPTTLVSGISNALSSIVFIVILSVIGKRRLILISLFGGSIAFLLTPIFRFLSEYNALSWHAWSWTYAICTVVANFFFAAGIMQIPLILNGELFPSRLRNVGAGFGLLFMHVALYGSRVIYTNFSLNSRLLAVAGVHMFGCISLFWLFPRNENKSLVEIEENSDSINNLKRKK